MGNAAASAAELAWMVPDFPSRHQSPQVALRAPTTDPVSGAIKNVSVLDPIADLRRVTKSEAKRS